MGGLKFSVLFQPTTLFSLKDSNSTNSGARSLLLPSPYAIKMAILNQAITLDGIDFETGGKKNKFFQTVRDVKLGYFLKGDFCTNNCFVKILKPSRSTPGAVQETVSFREYIFINESIEIIFNTKDEEDVKFLKRYLHRINYFGKRGCFFQFIEYRDIPNEPNVLPFESGKLIPGILQQYDDFGKVEFDNVSNFSSSNTKRVSEVLILPILQVSASKSYTHYRV